MDLKMLLRYQISGSVFIAWFLLFHYSVHSADFADMATKIMDISSLAALVMAIPLGAIIHQFSVTIKNQIFGLCEESYLSDSPLKKPTSAILNYYANNLIGDDSKEINLEYLKYIQDKITNLNSFYYMRFDNGFLAPLLASALFYYIDSESLTLWWVFSLVSLCAIMLLCNCTKICGWIRKNKPCYIIVGLLSLVIIAFGCLAYYSASHENKSSVVLTTSTTHTESNIHYITTQDYSFESVSDTKKESRIIADNLVNPSNISDIKDDNIQKVTIIESEDTALNSQTFTCTTKCAKCSLELTCTISNVRQQQDKLPHIAKAEITKIDTTLLNKILIACLIISTLLLSYTPRIIQEIKEYTKIIQQTSP
ncbi:MAG: hypothetical protein EKK57_04225 [Proteobacteria bacterium]|nr:MAG: hypothetical protein EKK57_04225 [Pseudomonadota bacterium]